MVFVSTCELMLAGTWSLSKLPNCPPKKPVSYPKQLAGNHCVTPRLNSWVGISTTAVCLWCSWPCWVHRWLGSCSKSGANCIKSQIIKRNITLYETSSNITVAHGAVLKVKQMLTMHSIHPFWSTLQIKSAVFCQYFFVAQHQWLCHRCSVFKNLQCLFLNWSNSTMNDNASFPFNLRHNISILWWQTDAASDGHVEQIAELYIYIYAL